jgi:hypothetical protein
VPSFLKTKPDKFRLPTAMPEPPKDNYIPKSIKYKDSTEDILETDSGTLINFMYYNTRNVVEKLPMQILGNKAYASIFQEALNQTPWYKKLLNATVNGTPGSLCAPNIKPSLSVAQLINHAHFCNVARIIENTEDYKKSVPRGMLVMHSTGAGKTNVQAGIIDAFYDLVKNKGWRIYMITTDTNAKSNNMEKFASEMFYYPHFLGKGTKKCMTIMENELGMKNSSSSAEHRANWTTYNLIYNSVQSGREEFKDPNQKFIFVLDEIQSALLNNPKSQDAVNKPRKFITETLSKFGDRALLIMLTATPGVTAENLLQLMALTEWSDKVKEHRYDKDRYINADNTVKNMTEFQEYMLNKVSYLDMNGMQTLFPKLVTEVVYVDLLGKDTDQAKTYLKAFKTEKGAANKGQGEQFLKTSRAYAHGQFRAITQGSQGDLECRFAKNTKKGRGKTEDPFDDNSTIENFSASIPYVLRIVERHVAAKQKIFLYTRYSEVAKLLICALTHRLNMPLFDRPDKGKTVEEILDKVAPHTATDSERLAKVAAMAVTNPLLTSASRPSEFNKGIRRQKKEENKKEGKEKDEKEENEETKKEVERRPMIMTVKPVRTASSAEPNEGDLSMRLKLWNHPRNDNGEAFAVLIGSQDNMQGLDLRMTPVTIQVGENESVAVNMQFDGRTVRRCSQGYDPNNQIVKKYKVVLGKSVEKKDDKSLSDEEAEKLDVANKLAISKDWLNYFVYLGNVVVMLREHLDKEEEHLSTLSEWIKANEAKRNSPTDRKEFLERAQQMSDLKKEIKTLYHNYKAIVKDPYKDTQPRELAQLIQSSKENQHYWYKQLQALTNAKKYLESDTLTSEDIDNVDKFVEKHAKKEYLILEAFYRALRQSAFDCTALLKINSTTPLNKNLKCGVHDIQTSSLGEELALLNHFI